MTLARALKEKNRLVGEVNRLWQLICVNNQKVFQIPIVKEAAGIAIPSDEVLFKKCEIDVADLYKQYIATKECLIKIKSVITRANAAAAKTLVALAEKKAQLASLKQLNAAASEDRPYGDSMQCIRYKLGAKWLIEETQRITSEVNALQDEIDEYNAKTSIELEA